MRIDTNLLRCLAALLIVNSHLESYYPIRQLAADGLLGNSLFLMLAGFGLVLSEQRTKRRFLPWYARRAGRILPSVFIIVLLLDYLPGRGWERWSLADYALFVGFGNHYHFVGMILVFYAVYYWVMRFEEGGLYARLIAWLFVPYAFIPVLGRSDFVFHGFHWIFYFQMMLLGGLLARHNGAIAGVSRARLAGLAALLILYVGIRFAISRGLSSDWFFLPHLLAFPIVVLLLECARSTVVTECFRRHRAFDWLMGLMAGATLEVYMIHFHLIPLTFVERLPCPLNVVVLTTLAVVLSCACSRLAGMIREWRPGAAWRRTKIANGAVPSQ